MHIIVLGATGPSGILVVKEYLKVYPTGTLVIYARNPSKLPADIAANPAVTVIKGELTDEAALTSAFTSNGRAVDAVLSTVGPTMGHPSTLPLTAAHRTIISVMAAQGCKRLITLSTLSAQDERDRSSLLVYMLVLLVWVIQRNAYKDIVAYSKLVVEECAKHDIDWTLVRVPNLNSKTNQRTVAGYIGDGKTGVFLSRHAIAEFYVREIEGKEWTCKSPALSSTAK
ncbi:NAD(P)-binding protein [Mycena galopus ATCC 62051]|nr:NAD(P)-binding protein [Mycena galopus ATCC 62051]